MNLSEMNVGVILWAGFQELEFWYPVLRLREAGAKVTVIGAGDDGTYYSRLRYPVIPDVTVAQAAGSSFDMIVAPSTINAMVLADAGVRALLTSVHANGGIVCVAGNAIDAAKAAGLPIGKTNDAISNTVSIGDRVIAAATADDLPAVFVALQSMSALASV